MPYSFLPFWTRSLISSSRYSLQFFYFPKCLAFHSSLVLPVTFHEMNPFFMYADLLPFYLLSVLYKPFDLSLLSILLLLILLSFSSFCWSSYTLFLSFFFIFSHTLVTTLTVSLYIYIHFTSKYHTNRHIINDSNNYKSSIYLRRLH